MKTKTSAVKKTTLTPSHFYDVVIIGSGFSGLCMGIKLKEAGITNFIILEKANEVGGTWRDNHYPGCACDVKSHLYSFSFEGNPNWSHSYAGWKEIKAYIQHCADKYGMMEHIQFNTTVNGAVFQEREGFWTVSSETGDSFNAQSVVMGTGPLHVPSFPNIKGLDTFEGEVFHSAQWNHKYNLKGKRVASIGTGASAIQYIPEIAPKVKQLYVHQRTPAWVLPRDERTYSKAEQTIFEKIPLVRKLHRYSLYWFNESRLLPIRSPTIARALSKVAVGNINNAINDAETAKKLTPDYAIGCKRVLISNTFYPAFNRPNVELVTDGIQEVKENSIVTQDGKEREVDAIVLGTGFVVDPRKYLKSFNIQGLGGRNLLDTWKDGAESYLGITVPGYPNLFQMTGPNTGLGHNSLVFMIECQVRYIVECMTTLKAKQAKYADVRESVHLKFNQMIEKQLKNTVWTSGCQSWYQQADGKNFTIWPGFTFSYRLKTEHFNPNDYWWERQTSTAIIHNNKLSEAPS